MKIVFLDIDGVLNSEKFYRKRGEPNYRFDLEPPYPLCEFDYEPLEFEDIKEIMSKKNYKPVDHHK